MTQQKNVLIAEDETNIALALKTIVKKTIGSGNVVTVSDGQQALDALQKDQYDLLISDWNMPRLTGIELLNKIRADERTEKLPFLMLTARADVDSVKTALGSGVTDYISKPFDKNKLIEKINKFLGTDSSISVSVSDTQEDQLSVIDTIANKLKKGDISFPVLPEVAFKAVEVINSKEANLQEVTDIIKVDAGLTSKMIAVANSALYRAAMPIQDLQYAISRIGLRDSGNIILMYSTRGLFNSENPMFEKQQRKLWEHALATATGARFIGRNLEHPFPERLYAAGMLHDMGKVLLTHVLMELIKVREGITEQDINQTLDNLHIDFGVALLKRWQFPSRFIDVTQNHHSYDQMHGFSLDTQIISYANLLTRQMDMSLHSAGKDAEVQHELENLLGITKEQAETMTQEIKAQVLEIKNVV